MVPATGWSIFSSRVPGMSIGSELPIAIITAELIGLPPSSTTDTCTVDFDGRARWFAG